MAFDYRSILTTITDRLSANTATLDASLTTDVKTIQRGDPNNIPLQITQYPAVFCQLISKDEDFSQIGQRTKEITVTFNIYGLVQLSNSNDASDREVQNLARNLETVLRSEIRLSNTVLFCNPVTAQFDQAFKDGIWLSAAFIELECTQLTT